jgi:predicted phosphate transport protein (TIGR00153 family)
MSKFHNILEKSPFDELKDHIKIAHESVELLKPFIEAALEEKWDIAEHYKKKITALESKADLVKAEMRLHLHKGLYLPVQRSEILGLIKAQDKLADIAEDIALLVFTRKLKIPQDIKAELLHLLNQVISTSAMAEESVNELNIFFASGFSIKISCILEKMLTKVTKMEHIADTCATSVRQQLLQIEPNLDPVKVIFLYKLIELIGRIADAAESIGDRISLLLAT